MMGYRRWKIGREFDRYGEGMGGYVCVMWEELGFDH